MLLNKAPKIETDVPYKSVPYKNTLGEAFFFSEMNEARKACTKTKIGALSLVRDVVCSAFSCVRFKINTCHVSCISNILNSRFFKRTNHFFYKSVTDHFIGPICAGAGVIPAELCEMR